MVSERPHSSLGEVLDLTGLFASEDSFFFPHFVFASIPTDTRFHGRSCITLKVEEVGGRYIVPLAPAVLALADGAQPSRAQEAIRPFKLFGSVTLHSRDKLAPAVLAMASFGDGTQFGLGLRGLRSLEAAPPGVSDWGLVGCPFGGVPSV